MVLVAGNGEEGRWWVFTLTVAAAGPVASGWRSASGWSFPILSTVLVVLRCVLL